MLRSRRHDEPKKEILFMTEKQLDHSHSDNGPADGSAHRRNRDPKAVLSSRVRLFKG
jgi:hypothetical protein